MMLSSPQLIALTALMVAGAGWAFAEPAVEGEGNAVQPARALLAEDIDGVCFLKRVKDRWEAEGRPEIGGWYEGASDEEAKAAYQCVKGQLAQGYARSGEPLASLYTRYDRASKTPVLSERHNNHYVNVYLNSIADRHAADCASADAPTAAIRVTSSFRIRPTGRIVKGPLFVFVKMGEGYDPLNNDWRAQMIMPTGKVRAFADNKRPSALFHDCQPVANETEAAPPPGSAPNPATGFDPEPESAL